MNIRRSTIINYIVAAAIALLLTACGGGGGEDGIAPSSSGLSLNITDAPVDDELIASVWVRFTRVIIHSASGNDIVVDVVDPDNPDNHFLDIDLMQLTEGAVMLLGEFPLDPGDYQWARLEIDLDYTYVEEIDGGTYPMDCPSCTAEQSGLKLNRPFTIEENGWVAWTIDFDLLKSLTMHPQNQNVGRNKYRLRPTLRIIETELASAYIYGEVTDNRSEEIAPAPTDCWVYVYEGISDVVEPDDLCFTEDEPPVECQAGASPLLVASVEAVPNDMGGTDYLYRTGFLYPDSLDPDVDTDADHDGLYTVAMLCDEVGDDPAVDEDFVFIGEGTVAALLPGGYPYNFELADMYEMTLAKNGTFNDDITADGVAEAGETVDYTFTATNEGNATLNNVAISDAMLGGLVCEQASLAPGDSLECGLSYNLLQADVDAGEVENTAIATSDETGEVSDTALTSLSLAP